jgi:osmotically-inducible protein OsmY
MELFAHRAAAGVSVSAPAGNDRVMEDEPKQYVIERVHRALAEDPRVSALDVDVALAGGRVFLTGDVPTQERKDAISAVVAEVLPDHQVCNETRVAELAPAGDPEDIA